MDQTEDTELRDLVVEALEKNGSLAKIRALLRANVFLVFEDEGRNLKQNANLDNILKLPEGALCLSIIHEFLEFCSLKNTLFVYMAESRQGTGYKYEGKDNLASKLKLPNRDNPKEPLLMTLLRCTTQLNQTKNYNQSEAANCKTEDRSNHSNFKDDQNCSYIIHEDSNSSGTSQSHSDKSSDDKNKVHLRLQLDNYDTDTSSDSTRGKSRMEYNIHILADKKTIDETKVKTSSTSVKHEKQPKIFGDSSTNRSYLQELKLINTNSSTDSTSYLDLKTYNPFDCKLLNTTGIPVSECNEKDVSHAFKPETVQNNINLSNNPQERISESLSNRSLNNEEIERKLQTLKLFSEDVVKSDAESLEYSNDFDSSPINENKNITSKSYTEEDRVSYTEGDGSKLPKNTSFESPRQSSRSSISISDVADLLSERSSSFSQSNDNNVSGYKMSYNSKKASYNIKSDDSTDFSGSPIPSLSNLSFDIHSD